MWEDAKKAVRVLDRVQEKQRSKKTTSRERLASKCATMLWGVKADEGKGVVSKKRKHLEPWRSN